MYSKLSKVCCRKMKMSKIFIRLRIITRLIDLCTQMLIDILKQLCVYIFSYCKSFVLFLHLFAEVYPIYLNPYSNINKFQFVLQEAIGFRKICISPIYLLTNYFCGKRKIKPHCRRPFRQIYTHSMFLFVVIVKKINVFTLGPIDIKVIRPI